MSSQLGSKAITSGTDGLFQGAPNNGVKAILIGNESGLTCTITMQGTAISKTLYPGTVDWFEVRPGFSGNIAIHPYTVLNNVSSFPASSLIFDAIGLNDPEEASMYPVALQRNTNIGNTVSAVGGIATAVTNTGNAAGTDIILATVSGDVQNAVELTNTGVLNLGDSTYPGTIKINGGNAVLQTGAGNLSLQMPPGGTFIQFRAAAGNAVMSLQDNGQLTTKGLFGITVNGVAIWLADNTQTLKPILLVNSSNEVIIQQAGAAKIVFLDSAGTRIASIDSSGNMKLKGTLTQNTTP